MRSGLRRAVYLGFDGWRKINVRSATSKKNRGFSLKNPHRDESLQMHASHLEVGWYRNRITAVVEWSQLLIRVYRRTVVVRRQKQQQRRHRLRLTQDPCSFSNPYNPF